MRLCKRTKKYHMTSIERSKIMEVPYVREREEEDEENGVNLQTRRKSKFHHQNISNISFTSSYTSVITTELSNTSFEDSSTVSSKENYNTNNNNSNGNNYTITIGEKPKFIEGRSVNNNEEAVEALSEADEKASFDETNKRENYSNVSQNQDSNGTTARQTGVGVIEYSFSESNGGDKGTDIGSNTGAGLKDESSSGVNVTPSEIYNTEDTLRKIVVLNDQGEVVETSHSEDIEQEFEEYHVESVVKNQKTQDIICPNCKHCITDRVILKRRKRKTPEPDAEIFPPENQPSHDEPTPGHVEAISCFSCFSIFIPKGDGFLCWRFKPRPSVPFQQGGTPPEHTGLVKPPLEDGTGSRFPLWILTCCQPAQTEKPVPKPGQEPPLTPEDGTEGQGHKTEVPSPSSHEGQAPVDTQPTVVPHPGAESQLPPTPEPPRTPESGQHFPLWILNCCQPSTEKPGSEVPPREIKHPSPPSYDSEVPTHVIKPPSSTFDGSKVSTPDIKPPSPPSHGSQVPTHEEKSSLPPSDGSEVPTHDVKPPSPFDGSKIPIHEIKPPSPPSNGLKVPTHEIIPPSPPPSDGLKVPTHELKPPPPPPPDGNHIVQISREQSSVTPPNTRPRRGVSGLDIIKAIVYGGLVECITSLSVITSAAGGDATTLNIVALGLANVAGGLVLLLHSLRVLIHEHTADRYEDQLGRRDHFLLHAVVAVISHLVFGLLSPVIYGFSFRKSDNKDYKLATLAAASLVCIIVLSIGKAYVRRLSSKAYIQTIFYYISVGFMVSGVGYVAGDLINMLLKKLGVFDSSAPVAMSGVEAGFVDGASSSY